MNRQLKYLPVAVLSGSFLAGSFAVCPWPQVAAINPRGTNNPFHWASRPAPEKSRGRGWVPQRLLRRAVIAKAFHNGESVLDIALVQLRAATGKEHAT